MAKSPVRKTAKIVFGLGFGDEGKGSFVDYFCRQVAHPLVVRFNGGAQAAHNVVMSDGMHHTFQQFGAGTLAGAKTLLSRFMLVDPIRLATEATELSRKLKRWVLDDHFIDAAAPVITPFHAALNRMQERALGANRRGSCGNGIGELMQDITSLGGRPVLRMGDLLDMKSLRPYDMLREIQWKCAYAARFISRQDGDEYDHKVLHDPEFVSETAEAYKALAKQFNILPPFVCRRILEEKENLVFEGAQGVLLDENFGFPPHYTWSNCTPTNALTLLEEVDRDGDIQSIGVLRSYCTRHGAGPMPTEGTIDARLFPGEHNKQNEWQGAWRVGAFDAELACYAARRLKGLGLAFDVALTHMDITKLFNGKIPFCSHLPLRASAGLEQEFTEPLSAWNYAMHDISVEHDQEILGTYVAAARVTPPTPLPEGDFVKAVEAYTGSRVRFISRGATAEDKEEVCKS